MKILRGAADIYSHIVGGFGIHIHKMSKEQVRLGHDVAVYMTYEGVEPATFLGLKRFSTCSTSELLWCSGILYLICRYKKQ